MIVVDASVIANAVADDDQDGNLVRTRLVRAKALYAPDLLDVEVLSVLRRRWLAGALTQERFEAAIDDLIALPVERVSMLSLVPRAFALRSNVTAYDGVYLALAEALDVPLLTADRRLAQAPGIGCAVETIARR